MTIPPPPNKKEDPGALSQDYSDGRKHDKRRLRDGMQSPGTAADPGPEGRQLPRPRGASSSHRSHRSLEPCFRLENACAMPSFQESRQANTSIKSKVPMNIC